MRLFLIVVCALSGCATAQPAVQIQGITDQAMLVEKSPLPDRPDKVPLTDAQNQSYPVTKGTASPVDGIVISPEKAARVLKLKVGYDELRTRFDYDRIIFTQNRIIYEDKLKQANDQVKLSTPGWWDLNKGIVGLLGGLILGAGAASGVAVGLLHAR